MEQNTRVRINLSTKEIEVEGSEAFVKEYAEKFEKLLATFAQLPAAKPAPESSSTSGEVPPITDLPPTFGEYLHMFPSSITDLDRMLIAGYYAQSQSSDNSFTTASAHDLLKEQGFRLGNAADCVTKNKKAKKVFALEKGRFRVSRTGNEHINSLLARNAG